MKKIILTVAAVAFAVVLASCGGAPAPVPAPVEAGSSDDDIAAALTANYFSNVKVDQFTYGDAEADLTKVQIVSNSVKACFADPQFVELNKKGYKVYAVGHACKFGSKGANYGMGLKRAKTVMYELRALKLDAKKIGVTSEGDFNMWSGANGGYPDQRRVTFQVLKKGYTLSSLIKKDKMKNKPKKDAKK